MTINRAATIQQNSNQDYPIAVRLALKFGFERAAVRLAIRSGQQDPIQLTRLVFYQRHAQLECRPLVRSEAQFMALLNEWQEIRETMVQPALCASQRP